MQNNFRPVQTICTPKFTKRWDPYLCKKEESCKSLFTQVPSNDALYTCRIPFASSETWGFGPKIGLNGLHGLAQVWTPLPPDDS